MFQVILHLKNNAFVSEVVKAATRERALRGVISKHSLQDNIRHFEVIEL